MPPVDTPGHIPVLLEEVLHCLSPQPGKTYADATLGAGGHARAILERIQPGGKLVGIDQDADTLAMTQARLAEFGEAVVFAQGNFSDLGTHLHSAGLQTLSGGILADLGVSSMQLDQGERGFSFSKAAPLDMRMDRGQTLTAADIVNHWPEEELIRIFKEYGEERYARPIAQAIINARPLSSTVELAEIIARIYHRFQKGKDRERIHPATRVFQALRIAVNDELGHLERFLASLPGLLEPGARIAMISFHSLEDRIVKRFFQQESKDCLCPPRMMVCQCGHQATLKILTSKPLVATDDEIRRNPRARSAKLRCAERLGQHQGPGL